MKNYICNVINRYSLETILDNQKHYFIQETSFRNLLHGKVLAAILLLLHIPFLYIDYNHCLNGLWQSCPGYKYLFYDHVLVVILLVIFFGLTLIRKPVTSKDISSWHRILIFTTLLAIITWGASVGIVDQMIHGQITVYILTIFVLATFFYFSNPASIILYGIPSLVFFSGLSIVQTNQDILLGHYINGSALVIIGWVLSRIIFYAKVRDYKNTRIIEDQKARLEKMSLEDSLTGLYNRRHLETQLRKDFARAKRHGHHLTVAMGDIDHFKRINDNFSHQIGDEVLKTVARIFLGNIRQYDDVSRYGGEEFVLIMIETPLEVAAKVCERIREAIENYDWNQIHPQLNVAISFGLAESQGFENYEKLLSAVDARLYEAKRAGRNQVRY